jgi:hypothetical protein
MRAACMKIEISLSRKENENNLNTQPREVVL